MGGASGRGRKRGKCDHTIDGREIERMLGAMREGKVWNMHGKRIRWKKRDCLVEALQRTEKRRNSTSVEVKVGKDEWKDPTWKLQPAAT